MVNAKHDTHSYERTVNGERGYQREILFDGNVLYDSYLRAKKGSDWKPQVQRFEKNYLLNLAAIQSKLKDGSYEFSKGSHFILRERGKTRPISGEKIEDRIIKHALCDTMLLPAVKRYLIYDNGASLPGKGVSFTRKRLLRHLSRYYKEHGSNEGYVLLLDFSKYYDNICHDVLKDRFRAYLKDESAFRLLEKAIDQSKVDVSYMGVEEYGNCMNILFDFLEYAKIDKRLLTGEKFMSKHMSIGDQVSQTAGIAYRIPIDNYVKIVCGSKYYAGYMDDSYVIHEDKEFLGDLLAGIIEICSGIGITINMRKTRICKLSDRWRFLQIQYSLTDTGRIIQKINPVRLTAMRRKMKKIAPRLTEKEFSDFYNSWFKSHYKYMSKMQRYNMDTLYAELKEKTKCTL